MSPKDKQTLRDAFQKVLDRDPAAADAPFTLEGIPPPTTHRKIIENTLEGESFFDGVEQDIKAGRGTLPDYVKAIESVKFPPPKP